MNIDFAVKIMGIFTKDTSIDFTILQASNWSGLSYNAANRTVHALIKRGVLNHRRIGGSILVSLNKTPVSAGYLALAESFHSKTTKELTKKIGEYEKQFI